MPANSGSPASAGTRDVRVVRIEEGIPAVASVENPTANPPTINSFDTGAASGGEGLAQQAQIDTTETARVSPSQLIKRGKPNAW